VALTLVTGVREVEDVETRIPAGVWSTGIQAAKINISKKIRVRLLRTHRVYHKNNWGIMIKFT